MKTTIIASIAAFLVSALTSYTILYFTSQKSENDSLSDYYTTQVATNISAHGLRKKLSEANQTFYLVDVRSEEEYLEWHIAGAINIPAYTNRENSQNISNEEILSAFQELDRKSVV